MSRRRQGHPARRQGHPARLTRADKRQSWYRPDKDEAHVREMARRWREERLARIGEDMNDGDVSGLLAVAAEVAAAEHADDDEYRTALAQYLYGIWGETIHRFTPDQSPGQFLAGLPGYAQWRARTAGPVEVL